jgi:hypothetical protein
MDQTAMARFKSFPVGLRSCAAAFATRFKQAKISIIQYITNIGQIIPPLLGVRAS